MEKILKKVFPQKYPTLKEQYRSNGNPFCFKEHSYELQTYFTGGYKTKLIHTLIQEELELTQSEFGVKVPSYIDKTLEHLKDKLEGGYNA